MYYFILPSFNYSCQAITKYVRYPPVSAAWAIMLENFHFYRIIYEQIYNLKQQL